MRQAAGGFGYPGAVASLFFRWRNMSNSPADEASPAKDIFLAPKPKARRRKHEPMPNMATWLFIAWLLFMAAWGCKHLYRIWFETPAPMENSTVSLPEKSDAPAKGDK